MTSWEARARWTGGGGGFFGGFAGMGGGALRCASTRDSRSSLAVDVDEYRSRMFPTRSVVEFFADTARSFRLATARTQVNLALPKTWT